MYNVQFQKISIPKPWRDFEILEGRGVRERTKLQSLYGRNMEVPEDRGVHLQNPSVVGVWIFSGTAQCNKSEIPQYLSSKFTAVFRNGNLYSQTQLSLCKAFALRTIYFHLILKQPLAIGILSFHTYLFIFQKTM